ncbi:DUF2147 domain-containing protein [Neorhizobium sp. P12A]|jgi:uncharacterized protein (DUF2147 family)|uniref:DUF2147 domain-containing protein n=1 Tax=Neorhizobium sp. P12A TaxID=2268027 RepID=UPI0011ED8B8C|nr:DUF2147 domain-containing protein [Neorhizobium sp. P12A]KAA0699344.1 DUF2147 domain-containing protein [Neorhizobium sp. P12A]
MRTLSILAATFLTMAGLANASDPLLGNWKTQNGETSEISRCGSGYCITAKTGQYAGRQIGTFSGKDDSYSGKITDPQTNRTYSGTLKVSGDSIKLTGCAMNVLCKSQTWTRR